MNNLGDYLDKKSQQLDLGRQDELHKVQAQLEVWFPGKARAQKLMDGKLTISTTSSSVANELRFKQEAIKQLLPDIKKIIIR